MLIVNRMSGLRCSALRPYLCKEIEPICRTAHARFFAALQRRCSPAPADSFWSSTSYDRRVSELRDAHKTREKAGEAFPGLLYPRMRPSESHDIRDFVKQFGSLDKQELAEFKSKTFEINGRYNTIRQEVLWLTFPGRVHTVREAGSKLLFVDILHDDVKLQTMINLGAVQNKHGYSNDQLRSFRKTISPGDYFCQSTAHPESPPHCLLTIYQHSKAIHPRH